MSQMTEQSPVTLPSSGTGARSQRRHESAQRRKRLLVRIFAAGVLIASIAGTAWLFSDNRSSDSVDTAAGEAELEVDGLPPGEASPKALIIQENSRGELSSVVVAVLTEANQGGSVIVIPPHTMVESPGLMLDPLSKAYEVGGTDQVETTVQNLLGVGFDHVVLTDRQSWSTLLGDLPSLQVNNPKDVQVMGADQRVTVPYPAGVLELTGDEIGAYLEAEGINESELDRMVRHSAVWTAWMAELGEVDQPIGESERDFTAFLGELSSGDIDWMLLPVETAGRLDGYEIYGPVRSEIEDLIRRVAPETRAESARRVGVQLLNGTGVPDLATQATEILVPAGGRIDLKGNALTFDHETTQIVYYRDEDRAAAERLYDALGLGEVVKSLNPLDAIDITVVLGFDFVERYT